MKESTMQPRLTPVNEISKQPRLVVILSLIHQIRNTAIAIECKQRTIADVLVGVVPSVASENINEMGYDGLIQEIESTLDIVHEYLRGINAQQARLDSVLPIAEVVG